MAKWNKSKVLPENINSGNEFAPKDNLTVDELNAIVNNSFYGVDFVEGFTETPDVSGANVVGTPQVSLIPYEKDGRTLYKFKFLNLKGQKGDKGDKGETGDNGDNALTLTGVFVFMETPTKDLTFGINYEGFNRTPVIDEVFVMYAQEYNTNNTYQVVCKVTSLETTHANVLITNIVKTTGIQGEQGIQGETGLEALVLNKIIEREEDPVVEESFMTQKVNFNRTPITNETFIVVWNNTATNTSFLCFASISIVVADDPRVHCKIINVMKLTGDSVSSEILQNKANLTGGNSFTGNQIITGTGDIFVVKKEGSDGQTVLANGTSYLERDGEASYQTPTSITFDNENGVYVVNYPTNAGTLALKEDLLNSIYPVGSVYLSVNNTSPSSLFGGSWTRITNNAALWIASSSTATGGSTLSAGLPNITGYTYQFVKHGTTSSTGVFKNSSNSATLKKVTSDSSSSYQLYSTYNLQFNASDSNSIYGNSTTVQPPAVLVFVWKRVS